MKRLLFLFVVLTAAWFAFKNAAYEYYLRLGPPVEPAALSYVEPDHWAIQPVELPPGAWAKPWGIDAFLVLPPAMIPAKHGLVPADHVGAVTASMKALTEFNKAIPGDTPVYAPFYRAPSAANDLMVRLDLMEFTQLDLTNAFEQYLSQANRGRGIILIVAEDAKPFVAPLITRLQQEDLSARFAGLVIFGGTDSSALYRSLTCADVLEGACFQDVETHNASAFGNYVFPNVGDTPTGTTVIDAEGVANAIRLQTQSVSTWLDNTQPKPVEPFGAIQIISSAPIYKPQENLAPGTIIEAETNDPDESKDDNEDE